MTSKDHDIDAVADALPETTSTPARPSRWTWVLIAWPVACLGLLTFRPDALAALTVLPVECWLLGGVLLQTVTWTCRRCLGWQVALALCLLVGVVWLETPRSLARGIWPVAGAAEGSRRLKVVSLNAHVGSKEALQDLLAQQPDLVLLQESPGPDTVRSWAHKLFGEAGSVVWSSDCSLIARGRLVPEKLPEEAAFALAVWEPFPGMELDVVSLRLWPQPLRLDYWNRENWVSYTKVRQIQRSQTDFLREVLQSRDRPKIVGGDFNCPPADPAESPLATLGLRDAFQESGRGWGKTIINDFPFHRIDRVWVSPDLTVADVRAVRTVGSDHRLVRCLIDRPPTPDSRPPTPDP